MRRVGKGFSRVETPLFEGMLAVGQPAEEALVDEQVQVDDAVAVAIEENVMLLMMLFHHLHLMSFYLLYKNHLHLLNNNKLEIVQLKARVKKLEKDNKLKSSKLRRLRKVGASRRVESFYDMEDVFNQGRMIVDMDMDERIELVKDAEVAESEGRHAEK
nr:hypothetical protein [Tanacetum cinerariifolium]